MEKNALNTLIYVLSLKSLNLLRYNSTLNPLKNQIENLSKLKNLKLHILNIFPSFPHFNK